MQFPFSIHHERSAACANWVSRPNATITTQQTRTIRAMRSKRLIIELRVNSFQRLSAQPAVVVSQIRASTEERGEAVWPLGVSPIAHMLSMAFPTATPPFASNGVPFPHAGALSDVGRGNRDKNCGIALDCLCPLLSFFSFPHLLFRKALPSFP